MNTLATPLQTKRFYSCLLCISISSLIIGLTILTNFVFTHFDFAYALPIFGATLIIFSVFFGWLRRTTYLKYMNNSLIVKGAFKKTIISPLRTTDIEPVAKFSKFVVLRVNFALDGIQHSYFTFTDMTRFKMVKKRQAVSRVL